MPDWAVFVLAMAAVIQVDVSREEWREIMECRRKNAYDTKRRARGVAAEISARKGIALDVYECIHCGKWHLTKGPKT